MNVLYDIEKISIMCNTLIPEKLCLEFYIDTYNLHTFINLYSSFYVKCSYSLFYRILCHRIVFIKIKAYILISLIITSINTINTINTIILNIQIYALSSIYSKTCKIIIVITIFHFHQNNINRGYYSIKLYLDVVKKICCCIQILPLVITLRSRQKLFNFQL